MRMDLSATTQRSPSRKKSCAARESAEPSAQPGSSNHSGYQQPLTLSDIASMKSLARDTAIRIRSGSAQGRSRSGTEADACKPRTMPDFIGLNIERRSTAQSTTASVSDDNPENSLSPRETTGLVRTVAFVGEEWEALLGESGLEHSQASVDPEPEVALEPVRADPLDDPEDARGLQRAHAIVDEEEWSRLLCPDFDTTSSSVLAPAVVGEEQWAALLREANAEPERRCSNDEDQNPVLYQLKRKQRLYSADKFNSEPAKPPVSLRMCKLDDKFRSESPKRPPRQVVNSQVVGHDHQEARAQGQRPRGFSSVRANVEMTGDVKPQAPPGPCPYDADILTSEQSARRPKDPRRKAMEMFLSQPPQRSERAPKPSLPKGEEPRHVAIGRFSSQPPRHSPEGARHVDAGRVTGGPTQTLRAFSVHTAATATEAHSFVPPRRHLKSSVEKLTAEPSIPTRVPSPAGPKPATQRPSGAGRSLSARGAPRKTLMA